MSSDIPEFPLKSLCLLVVDCPHATPEWTDSGYVVLRNQNIKGGRLDLNSPSYTDEMHYLGRIRRAKPQAGDIVITREAPMGEVCQIPEGLDCCLGQRQVLLRPDPAKIDGRFMLYALQSPYIQHQIGWNEGTGSTVSNLRIPVLEALKIPTPSISRQKDIASILGALDDRIALLRETNATLEAIAQALFKSWFVDFDPVRAKQQGSPLESLDPFTPARGAPAGAPGVPPDPSAAAALFPDDFEDTELGPVPKGWRVGKLGDVATTNRRQIQPDAMQEGTLYVGLEHIPRQSLGLDAWATVAGVESAKSCFDCGDILFGKLRPYFHKVVIAPFNGVCSTDILVCNSSSADFYGFVAMHLFSKELIAYADRLSNGAKMPRVSWKDLAEYAIAIPPSELASCFTDIVQPFFARITANVTKAQTLASLRDTLLPRLISGQLRLPEAESQLAEVTT